MTRLFSRLSAFLLTCLLTCLPIAAPAGADEAADARASAGAVREPNLELPPVTVTSDKRETDVQRTPASITVITGTGLQDSSVETIQDTLRLVPNLAVLPSFSGQNYMAFRGAPTTYAGNNGPLVINVDGAPIESFWAIDTPLIDIERVEVMRGVMTVLYGTNALGGVVNIVSKAPTNELSGRATVRWENDGGFGGLARLGGAIIPDRLFFSLAGSGSRSDGFIRNLVDPRVSNWQENRRAKGRLTAFLRDDLELTLDFSHGDLERGPAPSTQQADLTPRHESSVLVSDYYNKTIYDRASLQARFTVGDVVIESITGRNETDLDSPKVPTEPGSTLSTLNYKIFSQEIRVSNRDATKEDRRLRWLAGAFYSKGDNRRVMAYDVAGLSQTMSLRQEPSDFAVFGQVDVPLGGVLTLTPGLRWHRSASHGTHTYHTVRMATGAVLTDLHNDENRSWSEFLPKLTLAAQLTEDHMVYVGASRSFVPGGFNLMNSQPDLPFSFDKQAGWTYEAGAKTAWLDRRLIANLTFFYLEISDMQIAESDPITLNSTVTNSGRIGSYGVELDVMGQIATGLTGDVSFGWNRAKFKHYETPLTKVDLTGNYVLKSPDWTLRAGLTFRGGGFFARAEGLHTGRIFWDDRNTLRSPGHTVYNFRVGYEGERFELYAYGTNVFNEKYFTQFVSRRPLSTTVLGDGRRMGLEASILF